MKSSNRRFNIYIERYLGDPVLSQFRGLDYFATNEVSSKGIRSELLEIREV